MEEHVFPRVTGYTTIDSPSNVQPAPKKETDPVMSAIIRETSSPGDQFAILNGMLHSTKFEMYFQVGDCSLRVVEMVPDSAGRVVLTLESARQRKRVIVPSDEILLFSFIQLSRLNG